MENEHVATVLMPTAPGAVMLIVTTESRAMPSRANGLFQTGAKVSFSGSVLRVFSFLSVV